jgi:hypothetical protein
MSDNKQKYESSNAQGSQTWYPGPGIWSGMAAPWYAYPGWGCGHHSHPPAEIALQPAIQGAQWIGPNPGTAWSGPPMVWWAAHPAHAAASPGQAWSGPAAAQAQAQPQAASAPAQAAENPSIFSSGLGIHNDALVKGLLIGAGVAYLLTNETVQKNLMTAGVKLWSALQGCVEEMKERFRDAEAEAHASEKR